MTVDYGNRTPKKAMSVGNNTTSLASLTCGTTYHYKIYAKDALTPSNELLN